MPPCKSISDTSASMCLVVGIWGVSCFCCESRQLGDQMKYFTKHLHILSVLMMEVHLGGNFTKAFVCRSPRRIKSRHKAFELSPKKRELNLFLGHTPPNYPLTLQYVWDILEWKIKKQSGDIRQLVEDMRQLVTDMRQIFENIKYFVEDIRQLSKDNRQLVGDRGNHKLG